MKYAFIGLLSCFLIVSCNCAGPIADDVGVKVVKPQYQSSLQKRKKLIDFIGKRTVQVYKSCKGKEGVIFAGKKPRAFGSSGTGVIMSSKKPSEDGSKAKTMIVTAAHVIRVKSVWSPFLNCTISIRRSSYGANGVHDTPKIIAKIVSILIIKDLAYISIEKDLGVNTEIAFKTFPGMRVISLGYPLIVGHRGKYDDVSITDGVLTTKNIPGKDGFIHRISAAIYFGNSGGGVWTMEGKLLGISIYIVGQRKQGSYLMPYPGHYFIKDAKEIKFLLDSKNKNKKNKKNKKMDFWFWWG